MDLSASSTDALVSAIEDVVSEIRVGSGGSARIVLRDQFGGPNGIRHHVFSATASAADLAAWLNDPVASDEAIAKGLFAKDCQGVDLREHAANKFGQQPAAESNADAMPPSTLGILKESDLPPVGEV